MQHLAHVPISDGFAPVPAETANAWTHGLGCGLSLVGSVALMRTAISAGDLLTISGCGVYAASLVALYAASTLSHAIDDPPRKNWFRMVDQICIFIMITGSCTPFAVSHLRTGFGWSLLAVMWCGTLLGSVVRARSGNRAMPFVWYLPLALAPVLFLGQVLAITGATGFSYVIFGGLAYLVGLWFFVNDTRHPYYHAVWHCCVLVGSGLHFLFHYRFVIA